MTVWFIWLKDLKTMSCQVIYLIFGLIIWCGNRYLGGFLSPPPATKSVMLASTFHLSEPWFSFWNRGNCCAYLKELLVSLNIINITKCLAQCSWNASQVILAISFWHFQEACLYVFTAIFSCKPQRYSICCYKTTFILWKLSSFTVICNFSVFGLYSIRACLDEGICLAHYQFRFRFDLWYIVYQDYQDKVLGVAASTPHPTKQEKKKKTLVNNYKSSIR